MPVIAKDKMNSLLEDPKASTPEGEGEQQQSGVCMLSAPRGKPKAPPLIQRKIKPNEAGGDTAPGPGSGSKIPLLKTKQTDRESLAEDHGRASNSNLRLHPSTRQSLQDVHKHQRVKDSLNAAERVYRSVERVKLSKGIEMKRVVQESNGVTSKRFSSTKLATSSTTKLINESSHHPRPSERTTSKRMTKTEVSCPDVKSFTSIRHTRSNAAIGKPTHLSKATGSTTTSISKETIQNQPTNNEKAAIEAASSFKTVEEFLKMPETLLLGGPNSNSKKTLYKSKFWEYLDPSSKQQSVSRCKQQKKPYDPEEVKSFMDKQKETRKLQQLKESKEKQLEIEKRQRMLKDLNSKCHRLALKGKHKDEPPEQIVDTNPEAKKRKLELESPSLKYLKPLLDHSRDMSRRKSDYRSDTTKQAQYLLSEFENIVKRECISFLHRIPMASEISLASPSIEKVDKAVGTSMADSESKSQDTSIIGKEESFEVTDTAIKKLPSPVTLERAVTKIQAFFRGYKVRQALKEAKINLRKPWNKWEEFQQQQERARHRRWSFPKLPEKPYDSSVNSRLFPMSPIPMSGLSSDPLIPCYIPPPPPSVSSKSRSPTRPKVLPASPFTPVRLRVYDDPYPKQIKRTTESPSPPGTASAAVRNSLSNTMFDDFLIPTPLPSLVDVLREKIRLFSAGSESAAPPPAPPVATIERKEANNIQESQQRNEPTKEQPSNQAKTALTHVDSKKERMDDQESGTTPKIRKHKRRSRTRSKRRTPVADSTTTADTDVEYVHHGATQSQSMHTFSPSQKHTPNTSRSESSIMSSAVNEPSISSSMGEFLAPALRLRYEAEREHLKIIEKALQVKLHDTRITRESMQSEKHESPKEGEKKSSPESNRVQLAIANCHKESMKAAAEMAKWMADFQKTTQQQDKVQHTPVDLAAMVYAAVEEARIMGEEKRREKQLQQVLLQSEMQMQKSNSILQSQDQRSNHHSHNEDVDPLKVDKSVETSLTLFKSTGIGKQTEEIAARVSTSEQLRRDYQQQFPSASESERESPGPVPLTPSSVSAQLTKMSSVLADYTNSRMSEAQNGSLQLISLPPSTSSTLKSASILSEECRTETPKTDGVQLLEEPSMESIHDSPEPEPDFHQHSHIDEEQEKKSSNDEIKEMLSGSDFESEKFLSELEREIPEVEVDYVEEENEKSAEVSLAIVSSDEDVNTATNDGDQSPVQIPEESLKSSHLDDQDYEKQSPSTFESDTDSPSKHSIDIEIETDESKRGKPASPILSINDEEASEKSESPVAEEVNKSPPKTPTPCSATYSIESGSLSTSSRVELKSDNKIITEVDIPLKPTVPLTPPSQSSAQLTKMSPVLADYTNSRISEEQNGSLQQISPPPSTTSTLESTGIPSEEYRNEAPKTDEVQPLEEPSMVSIHDSPEPELDFHQDSHIDEEQEKKSTDDEMKEILSGPDFESDKLLSEIEKPIPEVEAAYVEEEKSPEVSLAIASTDGDVDTAKNDGDPTEPSPVQIPEESLKSFHLENQECEEQVPSTFESEAESPSKHSIEVEIETDESNREEPASPIVSINIEENSEKSESPVTDEVCKSPPQVELKSEDNQIKTDVDIPLKPPPPYSPSSSLDSISFSRSLIISLQQERIERIVREEADLIWESWSRNSAGDSFPEVDTIITRLSPENNYLQDQMDIARSGNPDITQSAIQSFDSLLHHLVYETIKEVLQVENSFTSYIERVRPGPLALQAQKLKIPKSKESLISCVITRVTHAIPSKFFTEPIVHTSEKYKGKKWCSRPKELVDEILLEELVEEDYQWTEWWPEQVIVEHIESKEIIKGLINSVLKNRKYVYSQ